MMELLLIDQIEREVILDILSKAFSVEKHDIQEIPDADLSSLITYSYRRIKGDIKVHFSVHIENELLAGLCNNKNDDRFIAQLFIDNGISPIIIDDMSINPNNFLQIEKDGVERNIYITMNDEDDVMLISR